jgi:hypothetical protein
MKNEFQILKVTHKIQFTKTKAWCIIWSTLLTPNALKL